MNKIKKNESKINPPPTTHKIINENM